MKKKIFAIIFLFVVLIGIINYNKNLDQIMSARANYYYKKNDYLQAQKYFEKAFDLGLHKYDDREAYVNSIINSPLDTLSQEKLVKFLDYPVDDYTKQKLEYFLYDLQREIHNKYPNNFISQTVFNQKVVRWTKYPITYTFELIEEIPEYYKKEIEKAFIQWEIATEHKLIFEESKENANIIIRFNKHNPANSEDKKYVVAYTSIKVLDDELKNMCIDFYIKDSQNKYFSQNQIYNTALHEIAHALGFMGHSNNSDNVMYITKDSIDIYHDRKDFLTEADVNTIKLLYNIKPDITNFSKNDGIYIPYLVLGDDKSITIAKKREAKTYIENAPTLPSGWIDLAETFVAQEDYSKAIKSLETALNLADTLEAKKIIYYNLAVCYLQIDNTKLAKIYAQKALEFDNSEDIYLVLAEAYNKEKNYFKAIEKYNYLTERNPKNINYIISLTNIYINQKKFFEARKVLKRYFENNPQERNNPRLNSYGVLKIGL